MTPWERDVLDRIELDDIVALTRALIAAPGENPPGGEAATAAALAGACRERGLTVVTEEVEAGRPNVSVTLEGGDGPGLLVLGHTDVVPVGEGWTVDPLGGEVRAGRLYGRGSTDMKGGLAAAVVAMAAVRAAGVPLAGPVELAAVVDEEESGRGIRHYIAHGGGSRFGACVVAEPTELQPIIAARGDSYLRVDVTGRAAHSGRPSDGVNAVGGAAAVVTELERWNDELASSDGHPLVGPPTWNVGTIAGGLGTSSVPATCRLTVDRRLLPSEEGGPVLAATRERISSLGLEARGLGVEIALTMEMPGFETPADHPFVSVITDALDAAGGPHLPLGGWTAACDGGFVARAYGMPVVVVGPGSVATQAHQPDESVRLDELHVAARTYALVILRTLGVEAGTAKVSRERG